MKLWTRALIRKSFHSSSSSSGFLPTHDDLGTKPDWRRPEPIDFTRSIDGFNREPESFVSTGDELKKHRPKKLKQLEKMTIMASSTTLSLPFNFSPSSFSPRSFRSSPGIFHISPLAKKISRSLSASRSASALAPLLPLGGAAFSVASPAQNRRPLTVVSAKGSIDFDLSGSPAGEFFVRNWAPADGFDRRKMNDPIIIVIVLYFALKTTTSLFPLRKRSLSLSL
ncbi:hypothetical protein U1Q18_023904 [Sarracenia purpurea var. burkii]